MLAHSILKPPNQHRQTNRGMNAGVARQDRLRKIGTFRPARSCRWPGHCVNHGELACCNYLHTTCAALMKTNENEGPILSLLEKM